MVDALIGLFILGMGAVAYYSLLPTVHRGHEIAKQESKASQIAARITEEIGMLKPAEVTASTLTQLNLIDAGQGAQPWSCSNIPLDNGTSYSPSRALRNGAGTITTTNVGSGSVLVTVRITWTSPTGVARSFTTGTIVGGYR